MADLRGRLAKLLAHVLKKGILENITTIGTI
jgi:hypothetical protein